MAHVELGLVQGWTGRLDHKLTADGVSQALTTSDTVAPWVFDKDENVISTSSGEVTILTASCGHVGWSPPTTCALKASGSPYTLRFLLTDGLGRYVFYPNDDPVLIGVRSV